MEQQNYQNIDWQEPRWFYCQRFHDYEYGKYVFIGENEILIDKTKWANCKGEIKDYDNPGIILVHGDKDYRLEEYNSTNLEQLVEKMDKQYRLILKKKDIEIEETLNKIQELWDAVEPYVGDRHDKMVVKMLKRTFSYEHLEEAAPAIGRYEHGKLLAYDILDSGFAKVPMRDGEQAPEVLVPLSAISAITTYKQADQCYVEIWFGGEKTKLKETDETEILYGAIKKAMAIYQKL